MFTKPTNHLPAVAISLFASTLALGLTGQLVAQDLAEPVRVSVELRDIDGKALTRVAPNQTFTLEINATDVLTGKPAALGEMTGWLRPILSGQQDCRAAGRIARSSGALPRGDISLNGRWFISIDIENRITVLDQEANGSKIRQIALKDLHGKPTTVRVDTLRQEILVALAKRKEAVVLRIPDLQEKALVKGNAELIDVLPAMHNGWWVAHEGQKHIFKIDSQGTVTRRVSIAGDATGFLRLSGGKFAVRHRNGVSLFDELTNPIVPQFFEASIADDLAFSGLANAILWHNQQRNMVEYRYIDDISNLADIPTALSDVSLSVAPPGRYLFATSRATDDIEVLDISRGETLWRGGFGKSVTEVAYGGGFAFLALEDRSTVIAVELDSLADSDGVRWREVRTGTPSNLMNKDYKSFPMLATSPEYPSAYLVKADKARGTAFRIMAGETAMSAPMSSVEFKSGSPIGMWIVERGLSKVSPGKFVAQVQVPVGGDFELIVTDGILGFTSCHLIPGSQLEVDGGTPEEAMLEIAVQSKPFRAGVPSFVKFAVVYRKTRKPVQLSSRVQVTAFELAGPWRSTSFATLLADGTLQAEFRFPREGRYPLIIEDGGIASMVPAIARVVE